MDGERWVVGGGWWIFDGQWPGSSVLTTYYVEVHLLRSTGAKCDEIGVNQPGMSIPWNEGVNVCDAHQRDQATQ